MHLPAQKLLRYLRMALSLIERRPVGLEELLPILARTMRQRRMDDLENPGYGEWRARNKPP